MSTISETDDQLHLLDNLEDMKIRLHKIVSSGIREALLFSRKLDPSLFNNTEIAQAFSELARYSPHSSIKILVEEPQSLVDANHQLLKLSRRLPSKIKIQKLNI